MLFTLSLAVCRPLATLSHLTAPFGPSNLLLAGLTGHCELPRFEAMFTPSLSNLLELLFVLLCWKQVFHSDGLDTTHEMDLPQNMALPAI